MNKVSIQLIEVDDVHLLFLIAKDLVTFARSDICANDIRAK